MITTIVSINFLSCQVDSVIGYVKKFSLVELSLKKILTNQLGGNKLISNGCLILSPQVNVFPNLFSQINTISHTFVSYNIIKNLFLFSFKKRVYHTLKYVM